MRRSQEPAQPSDGHGVLTAVTGPCFQTSVPRRPIVRVFFRRPPGHRSSHCSGQVVSQLLDKCQLEQTILGNSGRTSEVGSITLTSSHYTTTNTHAGGVRPLRVVLASLVLEAGFGARVGGRNDDEEGFLQDHGHRACGED